MSAATRVGSEARRLAIAALLLITHAGQADALFSNRLTGSIDLSAVQSESEGTMGRTLWQQVSATWAKDFTPYLGLTASIRYSKFDLDQPQSPNLWRQEVQPFGQFVWRHPSFAFHADGRRRSARARTAEPNLVTDAYGLSWSTRSIRLPLLKLRYDWDHLYEDEEDRERGHDVRDRRLQATADYSLRSQAISYRVLLRESENIITDLVTEEEGHSIRWHGSFGLASQNRIQVRHGYSFDYRSQEDQTRGEGPVLEPIGIVAGLYAEDPSPESGSLDPVGSLSDRNTQTPVEPRIDIGGGLIHRNIGADFGLERPVAALYIYTDRASGDQPDWRIFLSSDNLNWTAGPAVSVAFRRTLNRYEIRFPSTRARYIKAVNSGLNEVTEVFVTEIEALAETPGTAGIRRIRRLHIADFGVTARVTESFTSSVNMSYQREPAVAAVGKRDVAHYSVQGRMRHSEQVQQSAQWQQSFQLFGKGQTDLREDLASYALLVNPLPSLQLTLTSSSLFSSLGGQRERENHTLALLGRATPLEGLGVNGDLTRSRIHSYLSGIRQDVWNRRIGVDAALSRAVDLSLSLSVQTILPARGGTAQRRSHGGVAVSVRPTNAILLRASLDATNDVTDSFNQDYGISWTMSPKISMSAQASRFETDQGRSDRLGLSASYNVTRRSSLYFSLNRNDLSDLGGTEVMTYQQGFRTTF